MSQTDNDNRFPPLVRGLDHVPPALRGCVLTIGNFDGVHRGHQEILRLARQRADALAVPVVAMTFDPPPDLVLRTGDLPERLTPHEQKQRLLLAAGADSVVTAHATLALLGLEAAAFVEDVIVRRFAPRCIVEGPEFFFGRHRRGDVSLLQAIGRGRFDVVAVPPVFVDLDGAPQRVSSTLIRQCLLAGRVAAAAVALGRPFVLYGGIVPGAGQGRLLQFPTINVEPGDQAVPADGIYAGAGVLPAGIFPAAISIGTKPTLGPAPRTIEAHLIDTQGDFYGQLAELQFFERLRDQTKFDGMDSLRAQIAKDVERVRTLFRQDA